jgi:hypothetical protein
MGSARKSRNNLFGARLVWTPGTSEFVLENVAEGTYQAALSLRLRPRAVVGSTWTASTTPLLTATLTSRTWQPVTSAAGSPSDSIATITLSSGAVVRLSRQYGLLAGPRWLAAGTATAPQWVASRLPATLVNSPLSPTVLFNMQPGDRLGYDETPRSVGSPPCVSYYTLRAIHSRQMVGDSLIYTYQQQTRTVTYSLSGCFGAPGNTLGPVRAGRLAFSLRTGQSPQYPTLPLLSGEYRALNASSATSALLVGLGLQTASSTIGCLSVPLLQYQQMMGLSSSGGVIVYSTITDGNWFQSFSPQLGLGPLLTGETALVYFVRNTPTGPVTCGTPTNFANLLPTRVAEATALATLHPNPATEAATLTLAQPARAGHTLRLTDALGHTIWSAPLTAGQNTATVPLAGQPAGLYLLHLNGPNMAGSWKLTHE